MRFTTPTFVFVSTYKIPPDISIKKGFYNLLALKTKYAIVYLYLLPINRRFYEGHHI